MAKTKETFTRYDTADYLETDEDIAAYLTDCADEDTSALFLAAQTGLTRMAESMKAYEIAYPVPVGLFSTQTVMFGPNDCMQLFA